MLLRHIEWVGETIRIHWYDVDGITRVDDINVADAIDLYGWLHMALPKINRINEMQIRALQNNEHVERNK
jgi:hypothetical protein